METEGLSIICSGLGSFDEDGDYIPDDHCLDNLKDLLRFMRRDDPETRDVFKQVCKWRVVGKHLIPILEYLHEDRNLVLNAVKVLVFLTMPVEATSKDVNQQIEYLWDIKSAVTRSNVVTVIVSLLEKPLENLECDAFSEDDWKLVQLVLTLFRNLLAVQEISVHQKATGSASLLLSLRDDFLENLFKENVMDLIIIITQHVGGSCRYLKHDNLLLLDIYHYIFMGQDPESIAKACMHDSKDEDAKVDNLESIMQEEKAKRRLARMNASRHSQFSGTFTRLTLDGSKTMCKGVPTTASCDKLLKPEKVHRGPLKRVVKDYDRLPTKRRSVLEILHEFLNQFLTGGYNVLMQSIAEDIEKEHHAVETSDILVFFHLAQFAMSFQYHKSIMTKSNTEVNCEYSTSDGEGDDSTWFRGGICGPVAATMNEPMFGLVIAKWQSAFEGLKETKNNTFLSAAGSLMKIMIRMLDLVLKVMPEQSKEPQTARIILYKLFYDQTEQGLTQFLMNMVRTFDAHKRPKSDLADLVEIIHVVIRLMEKLQAHGTLRVAKKARKVKRKKTADTNNAETATVGGVSIQSEIQCASGEEPHGEGSCDKESLMQTMFEEKDKNVDNPIQNDETELSKNAEPLVDSSLPLVDRGDSNQAHGDFAVTQADESLVDHGESHQALDDSVAIGADDSLVDPGESNQPHDEFVATAADEPVVNHEETNQAHDKFVVTGVDDCDSSADDEPAATNEVDFKMTSWLYSLATSTIISNLCWLLKFYKSNSTVTNHYVVSLLRRICDDLDLAPMLYQLSCLVIFYDILNEQKTCPQKEYENVVQFLTSLIRRMLRKMKNQPLLFVDVLFWKTRKECHYINVESMQRDVGEMQNEVRTWDNVEEAGPSKSTGNFKKSLADALGDDEYDVIVSSDHDQKDEDLDEAAGVLLRSCGNKDNARKDHPMKGDSEEGVKKKKRRLVLSDKLEEQIRALYDKYKDDLDCVRLIAEALDPDGTISTAQVYRKCKKLDLQLPSRKNLNVEARAEIENSLTNPNHPDGPSVVGGSVHSRKRVRAIDENQELKIRSLFEQFKDHKRCSHMIAKELDPSGALSAAQVSRKLKKLGLQTSRMRGETKKQKIDDTDAFTDEEDDLDNLTLSLLRKRKSRKGQLDPEDKHDSTPNQDADGQGSGNQIAQDSDERDAGEEKEVVDTNLEIPQPNIPGSAEHQATGTSNNSNRGFLLTRGKHDNWTDSGNDNSDHSLGSPDDSTSNPNGEGKGKGLSVNDVKQNEHMYNELEDSEDEQVPSASPETSGPRRKLRVVLDFDDDE